MQVKFVDAQEVRDGEGVVIQKFKAGQVIELSTASARHWINRGLAIDVQGAAQDAREAQKAAVEEAAAEDDPVESGTAAEKAEPVAEGMPATPNPTPPKRGRGRPRSA